MALSKVPLVPFAKFHMIFPHLFTPAALVIKVCYDAATHGYTQVQLAITIEIGIVRSMLYLWLICILQM